MLFIPSTLLHDNYSNGTLLRLFQLAELSHLKFSGGADANKR